MSTIGCILFHGNYTKAETAYSPKVRTLLAIVGSIFFIIGMVAALERGFSSFGKRGGWASVALGGTTVALGAFFKAIPKMRSLQPALPPPPRVITMTDEENFCDTYIKKVLYRSSPLSEENLYLKESMITFLKNKEKLIEELLPFLQAKVLATIIAEYYTGRSDQRQKIFTKVLELHAILPQNLILTICNKTTESSARETFILENLIEINFFSSKESALLMQEILRFDNPDFDQQYYTNFTRFKIDPLFLLTFNIDQRDVTDQEIQSLFYLACMPELVRNPEKARKLMGYLLTFNLSQKLLHAAAEFVCIYHMTSTQENLDILTMILNYKKESFDFYKFLNKYKPEHDFITILIINDYASDVEIELMYSKAKNSVPPEWGVIWSDFLPFLETRRAKAEMALFF